MTGQAVTYQPQSLKPTLQNDRWGRYCRGPDNLGRRDSEIFADRYTWKRAALWLTGLDREKPGVEPVSAPSLARAHVHADSGLLSAPCDPAHEPEAAIAMVVPSGDPGVAAPEARPGEETVVGSVVAEGRDATPPGESDTTDAMVIASDLYGVIVVRRAPLDSWESGPMPREVATATRQKLVALGWRVKDLAGLVGVSRDHMENVLLGNYGLSGWPAERLKNWLLSLIHI